MTKEEEELVLGWTSRDILKSISGDGFIELEGLERIDLIGLPMSFKFGEKRDVFVVFMVIGSGDIPCPECKLVCDDSSIMKTNRESDDTHCDIFTCKKCGFAMSVAPETVLGEEFA